MSFSCALIRLAVIDPMQERLGAWDRVVKILRRAKHLVLIERLAVQKVKGNSLDQAAPSTGMTLCPPIGMVTQKTRP